MEEKSNSIWKAGLTYGAILGLITIIYTILLYVMDQSFNKTLGYVNSLFIIVMVYYGAKSYRDNYLNGYITYGRALGISMIIVLVSGVIGTIYFFIHTNIIDTEYLTKSLQYAEEELIKKGTMSDDQIEMAISMQKKMMTPAIMALIGLVGSAFWGFIISLVTSIFVKKQGDPYQEAMQDIEE